VPDELLDVTAAVIVRDGRLLIARRGHGHRHAGRWELPGGKVKPGESLAACLERELAEELGIAARAGATLCSTRQCDQGLVIALSALAILGFQGEPEAREHEELAWAAPEDWWRYEFLAPDVELLQCLRLRWSEIAGACREG
jgi:(d)CTP diphosphatase